MQPWEFAVLGGDAIRDLKERLDEKISSQAPSELEFVGTREVPEVYVRRRNKYYRENFDSYVYPLGTENVEEKKQAHFLKGGRLFDAPNIIMVYTDKALLDMPWITMSIGIIAQTACLAALPHGLGTSIMGRVVDWPDMLRDLLGESQSKVFICGIAIGYPDLDSPVNNVPRLRMPMEDWVHWYGI